MADLVANPDFATSDGGVVTVDVLANDTMDGAPVLLSDLSGPPVIVSGPAAGSAVVNNNGSITYTPEPGFSGVVTIEYEIASADVEVIPAGSGSMSGGALVTFDMLPSWWADVPEGGELRLYSDFTMPGPDWEFYVEKAGAMAYILDVIQAPPSYEPVPGFMEYRPRDSDIDFSVPVIYTYAPV